MTSTRNHVIVGDARYELGRLAVNSVDMVLTSPPYFRLRDYAANGQIGLEAAIDQWVDEVVLVMNATRRLLTPTGTLWLNLGDSYAVHRREGAPRKSMLLGPERVALRLISEGWVLRNKIVWQKANPMPTSVPDRLACTWEAVYVFAPNPSYFFDLDAVRVPHTSALGKRERVTAAVRGREAWRGPNSGSATGINKLKAQGLVGHPLGKNPGDVWRIATSNFRSHHHATFPVTLAERAIQAGAPEARCSRCRSPWRRSVIRLVGGAATRSALAPTCTCGTSAERALVLDPFFGAGTTAVAAEQLGRDWLAVELNRSYAAIARQRLHQARAGPTAA
jgi:DNA modification methylase